MKPSIAFLVYLVGLAPLGLFYAQLKAATGGEWLFLLGVVVYLLALRFIGAWLARRSERSENAGE
jgi:hypothetical protein